jgi:predicted nucleic acid-binding protein
VGLIADVGDGPVAVDTALFVYFIEEHDAYLPLVESLFTEIAHSRLTAVTSAITLLEVLVAPYRAGDEDLARRYEALLTRSQGLTLMDLSRDQLRAAAQLRGIRPQIRTPDALQLVAALAARCSAFVTNDNRLPSLPNLPVLQLSDYLASGG